VHLQAVVTMSELESWKESARSGIAQSMEKLHVRLQGCMLQLQEQLLADLAAKQAAAAAEEQVG
jgi:hypothetical protein